VKIDAPALMTTGIDPEGRGVDMPGFPVHPARNGESHMKSLILTLSLLLLALPAHAAKSCDELKSEIDAKLQAKGVKNYTLEIVAADAVKDEKVVGSCEGGTKKITYKKG